MEEINFLTLQLAKKYTDEHGGGGGTTNYNNLENKPQIGGVTLTGNMTASDLGLVAAEAGKGLSSNNYTNEDKAIVDGVTAALAGKQDALTAGNYIAFDDNEISVDRIVPNQEVTYQIVSDGSEDGTYFVRINKIVKGEIVLTERFSTRDNNYHYFDDVIRIDYAKTVGWNFTYYLMVSSTTHDAGYTYSWGFSGQVDASETVVIADHSGEKLIIKSEMDTALANKQDKTDNSLQTTDKTVVGAINEHEGDISSLMSGFTNLDNEVNGDATEYTYADVITIDDAVPANLADCSVKIEPVQSGSGDPSPTNVRPITGHTEASVQRDGVNLIENNTFSGVGTFIQSTVFPVTGAYIHRNATFSGSGAFTFKLFGIKNGIETVIDEAGYGVSFNDIRNNVSQYDHIRVSGYSNDATNSLTNIMVAFSDTDTPLPYEPYQGKTYTIALGDTIYGGEVDFDSGVMTVDRKYIEFDGGETETWTKRSGANSYQHTEDLGIIDASSAVTAISNLGRQNFNGAYYGTEFAFGYAESNHVLYVGAPNIENAEDFKTYLSNNHLQIVGTLVTPLTVQLTPQQIQLLKGQNTLTASTGDISVTVNGVSGAIGSLTSDKQDKTDYALETTEKTVVGAINEIKDSLATVVPTPASDVTITKGGYVKIGDLVLVDFYFTVSGTHAANTRIAILPSTAVNNASLPIYNITDETTLSGGRMYETGLFAGDALVADKTYNARGLYVKA